jgi:glycerol-3-phosphate dehydrogenase
MRIAPHLVHPLPVVLPTYGHGMKGMEVLSVALVANDLLTFDRNRQPDTHKRIPRGRAISKKECLQRIPGLPQHGLSGGIIFYDAQVYNSERLVLAFLQSAARAGAALANYTPVTGLLQENGRVVGLKAVDRWSGDPFEVQANLVINTAGPWLNELDGKSGSHQRSQHCLAKAVNLVTRQLFDGFAVGLLGSNNLVDQDSLVKKGASFLFTAPWRGKSLLGTSYRPYCDDPSELRAKREDVINLLDAFNQAYPSARLVEEDVYFVHRGLVPASYISQETQVVELSRHAKITDHRLEGLEGLISVEGVKYTTARRVAKDVIDSVFSRWEQKPVLSKTHTTVLVGGEIDHFEEFLGEKLGKQTSALDQDEIEDLVRDYGSHVDEIFECARSLESSLSTKDAILRTRVEYAIRHEMASTLSDFIMRRTGLGSAGKPPVRVVTLAAELMAKELGWGEDRKQQEIEAFYEVYNFASE